jgi:uncharacterized protein
MDKPFQILALSGGGFFGLYTLTVLEALERITGDPIARRFDLLAGTSVGGIIALGLAAEIPAAEIKKVFESRGTRIFSARPAPFTTLETLKDLSRILFKPKYRSDHLRDAINELIPNDLRIGDLKHRLLIPVINLTKGRPQVFKTSHHPKFRLDLRLKVVDVARCVLGTNFFSNS